MKSLFQEVVRASAGAGKTTALTEKYLSLLSKNYTAQQILATTFTNKAAHEIQVRIIQRLLRATLDSQTGKLEKDQAKDKAKDLELLVSFLKNQETSLILTLDSFFIKIAKAYSSELGLPLEWRTVTDHELEDLELQAMQDLLQLLSPADLDNLLDLIDDQKNKRSVIGDLRRELNNIYQVYRETEDSAWSHYLHELEYSDSDLEGFLEHFSQQEFPKTQKGELNKSWQNAKQDLIDYTKAGDYKEIIGKGFLLALIEGRPQFNRIEISQEIHQTLEPIFKFVKERLVQQYAKRTKGLHLALQMYDQHLDKLKKDRGIYTFTDIKYQIAKYADANFISEIFYRLDSKIRHLMLDEFQDTALSEWRILKPMVAELLAEKSGERAFFCVGDAKQAIYAWRGGKVEIFNTLSSNWPQLKVLEQNKTYRCSKNVTAFVNDYFGRLSTEIEWLTEDENFSEVQAWFDNFEEHSTASINEGQVALFKIKGALNQQDPAEENEDLELQQFQQIVSDILIYKSQNPENEVAILCRSNQEIQKFKRALAIYAADLKFSDEAGSLLINTPVIQLLVYALEYLLHPGDTSLKFLIQNSIFASIFGLQLIDQNHTDLDNARQLKSLYAEYIELGPSNFINKICDFLKEQLSKSQQNQLQQLQHFILANNKIVDLKSLINLIKLVKYEDPIAANLRLMTVHKAKGLEFDAVFMLAGKDNLTSARSKIYAESPEPSAKNSKVLVSVTKSCKDLDPEISRMYTEAKVIDLKESLSLLYVAFTRAKEDLFIYLFDQQKRIPQYSYHSFYEQLYPAEVAEPELIFSLGSENLIQGFLKNRNLVQSEADQNKLLSRFKAPKEYGPRKTIPIEQTEEDYRSLFDVERQTKIRRGVLFHAFLSQMSWLDDFNFENISRSAIQNQSALSPRIKDLEYQAGIEDLRQILNSNQIQTILSKPKSTAYDYEVLLEFPLSALIGGHVRQGVVDRLVLVRESGKLIQAKICDYKTSSEIMDSNRGNPAEYLRDKHREQLLFYQVLVHNHFQLDLDQIGLYLIALDLKEVIELV